MNLRGCKRPKQIRNIAHVIGPHIKALIQLLSNDFPQYNMKLQTTKCLNTGILLCLSLLGTKGLEIVNYCDSNLTTTRHKQGQDDNIEIFKKLQKQLFSKRERRSQLYYILLTDGYFPKQGTVNVYFPGHVILIEKHFDRVLNQHVYVLHQSYINEYDLHTFAKTSKTQFNKDEIAKHISGIKLALTSPTWTAYVADAWKSLTNVDTSSFLTSHSQQNFFMCFQKYQFSTCVKPLKTYINNKLKFLKKAKHAGSMLYGDKELYDDTMKPLSNDEMRYHLEKLHDKLEIFERLCSDKYNEQHINSCRH